MRGRFEANAPSWWTWWTAGMSLLNVGAAYYAVAHAPPPLGLLRPLLRQPEVRW